MYTRITTSGGRSHLQLVEGHRDEEGKVRIKVVANLGRLDRITPGTLDPLINGLNRAVGRLENTARELTHDPARTFGDVFALHELRKDLGFDKALSRALRSGKRQIDVEALGRAMVFNSLCEPDSKLGCLRWLETVAMPAMPEAVTHQHLLRAMDALITIPARGFRKCRTARPERSSHSITRRQGRKVLVSWAATKEAGSGSVDL